MSEWWINYPWRVIQPNFREIDTVNFDTERFIAELKEFKANVVMLNAAGLMASYPSALCDEPQSEYLDDFDLGALVERLHREKIKVIARTDFSKISESVFKRHPEWAYRHADGSPLIYNGYVQTCVLGGYQAEYMDDIIREMLSKIPFDGIYINMGSATGYIVDYSMNRHGPCHCDRCRAAFKAAAGLEIPAELRPGDRASMMYFGFQQNIAAAQKKRITELVHSISPEIAYCSVDYSRQEAQASYGAETWQYAASSNARMMRGMDLEATVANVDFMGFSYRHVSCPPALQELRAWQTLANFGGLDYYVMGRLYDKADKSAFERIKRVFGYAAEHENIVYGVKSKADILLVKDSYIMPNAEERGWVRLLTENHFVFDETLLSGLAKKGLSEYKLLILPDKSRIRKPLNAIIDEYVRRGGTVITSGAVPELEAVGVTGVQNTDKNEGAVLLDGGKRLIPGKKYIKSTVKPGAEKLGSYLAPERFGPPELCYATEPPTEYPCAVVNTFGGGKCITLPWFIGECYCTDGHTSYLDYARELIEAKCKIKSIGKKISPMVEVTRGVKDGAEIIHFVNGTGRFGNSFFDPAELRDQSITIPWERKTAICENIDDPDNVEYELSDGELTIYLPRLNFHACIAVKEENR